METIQRTVPGGEWRNGQWYSKHTVNNPAKLTYRNGLIFHLAYITEEESRILNYLGLRTDWFSVMSRDGSEGLMHYSGIAPTSWISEPSHAVSMLVYITQAAANELKRLDVHGSGVDKHDHFGPLGIPSYQGDGGAGGGDGGGAGDGGGGDSGGDVGNASDPSGSVGGGGSSATGAGTAAAGDPGIGATSGISLGSVVSTANTGLGIIGNIMGIISGNPIGIAQGVIGLGNAAVGLGLGNVSLGNASNVASESTIGLGGDYAVVDKSYGPNGGLNFGKYANGYVSPTPNGSQETPGFSIGDVDNKSVVTESGGDVAATPTNSQLTVTQPFDIMGLLLPVALMFIFKG